MRDRQDKARKALSLALEAAGLEKSWWDSKGLLYKARYSREWREFRTNVSLLLSILRHPTSRVEHPTRSLVEGMKNALRNDINRNITYVEAISYLGQVKELMSRISEKQETDSVWFDAVQAGVAELSERVKSRAEGVSK